MAKELDPRNNQPKWLLVAGGALTFGWLATLAILLWSRGNAFLLQAPLNEVGDFLAGAFAPVAFFWLIIAVVLQKQELRAQRQELELNREVLMLQADELKKSAAQLGAQAEILAKQLKAQSEQKALADIKEGIAGLRSILVVKLCGSSLVARSGGNLRLDSLVGSDGLNELGNGEFIEEFCVRLERSFRIINKGLQEKHQITIKKRPTRDELQKMLAAIDRILKIPDQEDCAELRTKFELEYPLPKLRRLLSDCEALVK